MTRFVPKGHLEINDAIAHVFEITKASPPSLETNTGRAAEMLRQRLYADDVPCVTLLESGATVTTPAYIWGDDSVWDGVLRDNVVSFPVGDGLVEPVEGRPIVRREALDHAFGDTAEDGPRRRGRKPKWDWDAAAAHLLRRANTPDGLPTKQADLEKIVSEYFFQTCDNAPAESGIRAFVRNICRDIIKVSS